MFTISEVVCIPSSKHYICIYIYIYIYIYIMYMCVYLSLSLYIYIYIDIHMWSRLRRRIAGNSWADARPSWALARVLAQGEHIYIYIYIYIYSWSHLSSTTCLARVFFKSGEYYSKCKWSLTRRETYSILPRGHKARPHPQWLDLMDFN